MQARIRNDFLAIKALYNLDNELIIEVDCTDYDAFKALPKAVEVQGKLLALTGWNSDRCYACYKERGLVARKV
jgi:hypothetical protein